MAKLDRPIYGEYATGTLARALAFRHTANPPDLPGEIAVSMGTIAKIPIMSCGPSPAQSVQRALYAAAVAAWNALSDDGILRYRTFKPPQLTGYNFFLRQFLDPGLFYIGYCVFGSAVFQLGPTPYQPAAADYDVLFPTSLDEFPTMVDGANSPQAWLLTHAYQAMTNIQEYVLLYSSSIGGS